jgi:hypothetical protein
MKGKIPQRKIEIYLMVGAVLMLLVGIPLTLFVANGFNGFLSGTANFTQIENTTAFYEGPILDEDLEGRYASVNVTTVIAETPTWDVSEEWDTVTIASTETVNTLVLNWNMTVTNLLKSKISQIRFKTNFSKELKITVNAVKWDGTTLTTHNMEKILHIGVDNNTVFWNITPSEVLYASAQLNPAVTDEVYFQFEISGHDATTNKLTTGDTLTFQIASASPSNAYSFTGWQILTFTASIMGLFLCFVALASTKYFNPIIGQVKKAKKNYGKKRRN